MLRRLVLQGGLLPIASVVIYSHFAVFFMAVMVLIIIVIYINSPLLLACHPLSSAQGQSWVPLHGSVNLST